MFKRRIRVKEAESNSDKPKEVSQILDEQIEAGLNEFNRSSSGLFVSAFAAGLEVGFSILFMCTIYSEFGGQISSSQHH